MNYPDLTVRTSEQETIKVSPSALRLLKFGPVHVMQIGYNLLQRQAEPLLAWCAEQNIGTLIRVPLAKGLLTGKSANQTLHDLPMFINLFLICLKLA